MITIDQYSDRINKTKARIANCRRAGVGHDCDAASLLNQIDELGGALLFVVFVITDRFRCDAVVAKQLMRVARVFAGDQIDVA